MLKLPDSVLAKLRCSQCGGYLSSAPVALHKTKNQICGKCFTILPDDKKSECKRQIGFEAVAEVLIFPCRYKEQGCPHTFIWNCEDGHETSCQYRYNTLPMEEKALFSNNYETEQEKCYYECECEQVKVRVKCENSEDLYRNGGRKLKFDINVKGNNSNVLSVCDLSRKQHNGASVNIESMVYLNNPPEITYCCVNVVNQIKENEYDTPSRYYKCNNCKAPLYDEIFHCLFGHHACKSCKGNVCAICTTSITGEARSHCKNYTKGCTTLFLSDDAKKHEIDCEFNDFKCPRQCGFTDSLPGVIAHFNYTHQEQVITCTKITENFSENDKELYFFCYDKLFVCKYFYYGEFIEYVVKYVGSNDDASNYKYQVTVLSDKFTGCQTRTSKCLGWNEVTLNKAISYEIKRDGFEGNVQFEASLSIIH